MITGSDGRKHHSAVIKFFKSILVTCIRGLANYMNTYIMLGERIREKRKQLNFSQEQLSEMCGLSPAYVGIIERGNKKLSVSTLVKIANALKVNADYLLGDSIKCDNSEIIEKAARLLNDMDEDEIQYTYELISNTRKFLKKNNLNKTIKK